MFSKRNLNILLSFILLISLFSFFLFNFAGRNYTISAPKSSESIAFKEHQADCERNIASKVSSDSLVDCIFSYIKPDYSKPSKESIQGYSDLFNSDLSDKNRFLCHILNHMLGKAYVLKSNQYNLLLGFKIKSCNDGFSHGVVEFINDFELKSDQPFSNLLSYCESFDEALDVNSCIHGFGHLLYRSYVNGVISLSEAYDFCKFSDYKVYTLNCGTGISMSIMMDNFLSSNPYNNMCRERTSIENITCLLYPTISKVDDPISSQKPYCDYLNSKDEVSLCEMGVLNNFFVLHSPEQLYNYCLKISLARSSCLHNFMLTLPSVYGMAEFRKYEKLLNDHDYTKVTAKEILSFSSLELVDIFNRIEL